MTTNHEPGTLGEYLHEHPFLACPDHPGHHAQDPVLDDSPTCWCGEPAEYVNPAEPDLFPTTTHLANGQPAYFTCFPHTHSDLAQPVGHLYSTYHGCLVAADNLGDTGTGWPTT